MNSATGELDRLIADLASIVDEKAQREFIAREPLFQSREAIDELHSTILRLAYSDVGKAAVLERAARRLGQASSDDYVRAMSARCSGHLHYVTAEYEQAVDAYRTALDLFRALALPVQAARTQSSAIQALSYLGRYEQAYAWAAAARSVLQEHQDLLRLARLDSNVANMLLRQDRYAEAIETYQRAHQVLSQVGEPRDIAAVLSNIAVCTMYMSKFAPAIEVFTQARAVCKEHGLSKLMAEIDYNIAWLHYLRGEYRTANELYQSTRQYCNETGDVYHASLCDLDESELFLDLNLSQESERLARRSAKDFERLGMRYERAKALVNMALASVDEGNSRRAMLLFRHARRLFLDDRNEAWPAVIDLYRAVICHREGRNEAARRYCAKAEQVLARSPLTGKAVLCDLLQAQICREQGELDKALQIATAARNQIEQVGIRSLALHANFLLAQLEEEAGDKTAAYNSCQYARREIESLRSRLWGEDVQMSFLRNKLSLYEMLVRLCLEKPGPEGKEEAFGYMEEAKSRSLAESLALQAQESKQAPLRAEAGEVQELRRELQGIYRQIERVAYSSDQSFQLRSLRGEANRCEEELARRVRDLGRIDPGSAALLSGAGRPLDQIRNSVPEDAVLLQYYAAGSVLYCGLLNHRALEVIPVSSLPAIQRTLRLLRFQMSKVRLGAAYLKGYENTWYEVSRSHLRDLYDQLILPLRNRLTYRHLIIAPHGVLHHLPFHALIGADQRYLIDDFTISYAPSASIFSLCADRPASTSEESLVFGVPDLHTPEIQQEVCQIAQILPNSRLFVGSSATAQVLRDRAPRSRIIHLASHGLFRSDNPLFSSIQLGDSRLSLLDLYDFQIPADLVTLSGCSTGMNEIIGGDELVGLVRGLLYAGARSLLVSLWEVHDKSTSLFMKYFYKSLVTGADKATALRIAMQATREAFCHPYHWAPFVMVGNYQD